MEANERELRRWLEQAQWDLEAARTSAHGGYYEWACFQAQQAAVKALRGFLCGTGRRLVSSHAVSDLLRRCAQDEPRFFQLLAAAELDQYYAATRYPDLIAGSVPHEVYSAEAAQRCQSLADSVIAFVRGLRQN